MTSTEKYSLMCTLSVKYFIKMSPALRKKVLEYAQKDPDLMKRLVDAYGIDLLSMSESPAILGMMVHELWNNPDNRYQIAKMVCENPEKFPSSVVEECELLLAKDNNVSEKDFNNMSANERKKAAIDSTFAFNSGAESITSSAQFGGSRNNRVLGSFNKQGRAFYIA